MHGSMILKLIMLGFLFGIFMGDFYLNSDFIKIFLLLFSFVIFWIWNGRWKILFFIFLGGFFGFFRFFVSFDTGEIVNYFSSEVELKACIETEVDVRLDKVKYTLDVYEVLVDDEWRSVDGLVLVNGPKYPQYSYGDCLLVRGEMQKPEPIEDFAYDKFLSRYGIYALIYRADLELLNRHEGALFFSWIYQMKADFERRLGRIFSEPHGSFMSGLILGSRKGIPGYLMEQFNITGLTHIIAISGYNITLLVVIIASLFSFLSRRVKVLVSIFVIIVFVILVGMSAAVVRAAVMGVIALMAIWFGRVYFVGFALFAAAFFMSLWNPKILVYDLGFQLSVLATCGLLYVSPLIEKYFRYLPTFFGIREAATMTIAAQVMALPVIILNFGRLSLISPVANVFILPFIPLAMIFGFFSVFASYVSVFFSHIFGFIGYLILELIIFLVKIFANFPFASVEITFLNWWMMLIYFLLVLKWILGV